MLKSKRDANLGGNLVKKRVAVGGRGKSAGLRTILVYKASAENVLCIYVFAKSERAMSPRQIELAVKESVLIEVE
ncbi:MAG: type II toxin-antitoxin system RelE/ParE family toxin [Cyanobacteria bacterium SZAS LIN-3]|nr:type II toxin-antitoxin system RelE/ParE family toxin [Cyanobacteria bacterium SZAS LIN-3]